MVLRTGSGRDDVEAAGYVRLQVKSTWRADATPAEGLSAARLLRRERQGVAGAWRSKYRKQTVADGARPGAGVGCSLLWY